MYSSDRMLTLIRFFKENDKNIIFRDCQMQKKIWKRKKTLLIIFVILLTFLPKIIFTN